MQQISTDFPVHDLPPAARQYISEDLLYFDIETTGLSSSRNRIYCIGTGRRTADRIRIAVSVTDSPQEESALISSFIRKVSDFPWIVAFNGNTFDLPFVRKRAAFYGLPDPFAGKEILDLYKRAKKASGMFRMPDHKQKSYEDFLGLHREDPYNGGQLISVYRQYEKDHDRKKLHDLWLHNEEDVKGMFLLTALLSYPDFLEGHYHIEETQIVKDPDPVLQIHLSLEHPVPKSIHLFREPGNLLLRDRQGFLELPIYRKTLRHYFKDYKNYYYLPLEGTVVHKSVGQFVDPSHREKAKKENCYVEKSGSFLWLPKKSPFNYYRENLKDKNSWLDIDTLNNTSPSGEESIKSPLAAFLDVLLPLLADSKTV